MIDAVRWKRLWPDKAGLGYLLRWQVERADLVLLSKSDAVAEDEVAVITAEMRALRDDVTVVPVVLTRPGAGEHIVAVVEEAVTC